MATAAKTQAKADIEVDVKQYAITGLEVPVSVSFTQVSNNIADSTKLLLSHQKGSLTPSDTRAWQYGYTTAGGDDTEVDDYVKPAGYDYSIVYKVTIAAANNEEASDGNTYTAAEVQAFLLAKGNTGTTVTVTGNQYNSHDRIHVEFVSSSTVHGALFEDYAYTDSTSVVFTDNDPSTPSYQDAVLYVLVSVEGSGFNDGTTALEDLGFTIVVGDGTVGS